MRLRIVFIWLIMQGVWAQEEPEAIALAENQFQEAFFESLKQRGIENYDKAIEQLQICLTLNESKAVVHHELGRNFLKLNKYAEAENAFKEAIQLDEKNKWHHLGLYDVYYQSRQYKKGIEALRGAIALDEKHRDELVTMYMYTQQYELALALIDELREQGQKSEKHSQYKAQILSMSRFKVQEKDRLIELIKKNPKEEVHYVSLIYLYSQNNEDDLAFEVAKQLAKEIPSSDWAHISLFKFHLDQNNVNAALSSFQRVTLASTIDERIRQRMFNEWLVYAVQNQVPLDKLDQTIRWMGTQGPVQVSKEVAKYFHQKNQWETASKYYDWAYEEQKTDVESLLLWFEVNSYQNKWKDIAQRGEESIDWFPAQPEVYLWAGKGFAQLQNFKKAAVFLQEGIDFVVEQPALERQFLELLIPVMIELKKSKEAEQYKKQLSNLKI